MRKEKMSYKERLNELKAWLDETRDQKTEEMAAFFDRRIGTYEEHMSPWQKHYEWMAEVLPESAAKLLDIGVGTGLELDEIYKRFPAIDVTCVDMSREMLRVLSKKHGHRKLNIIRGDYFTVQLGEGYDTAVAFETLHHYTKDRKTALYRRLYRALADGGVFIECDYIAETQEIEDLLASECRFRRERDGIAFDAFVHFDTPLTVEHELGALRDAGFSHVELVGFLPDDEHTAMIRAYK